MCVLVYLQSTAVLDWMVVGLTAGAGPAWATARPRMRRRAGAWTSPAGGRVAARLGEKHVIAHEHQLRTYESDGLLQYAVMPGAVVLPGSAAEERPPWWPRATREGVPWVARGAGSGLSGGALPVADGVLISLTAHAPRAGGGSRQRARGCGAGRDQRGRVRGGGPHPLLPARPLQPDRVHDRRERGRELRRRALLQVRLHHQLRDRPGARAGRRRADLSVGGKELEPPSGSTCWARSWARRARSAWPPRSGCGWCRSPRPCARSWPSSGPRPRPARWCRPSWPRGSCPGAVEMMDNLSIRAAEGYTGAG